MTKVKTAEAAAEGDLPPALPRTRRRYFTIGVRRRSHSRTFFLDIDANNLDVYRTKDGFHVVSRLAHAFDYKFDRLRVSPKFDRQGEIVNSRPGLVYCGCPRKHVEKRLNGRLEIYATSSR